MKTLWLIGLLFFSGALIADDAASAISDDVIKTMIIKESINHYPGNCPCPYNLMRNGRSCGGNSAYSKPGGYTPICYKKDVTKAMLEAKRKQLEK